MLSHTAPFESQSGNRKKKQLVLATHFDSLPDNSRASPDVCFVTNLRFPHHTTLRLVHTAPAAHLSCTKLPAALTGSSKTQMRRTATYFFAQVDSAEPISAAAGRGSRSAATLSHRLFLLFLPGIRNQSCVMCIGLLCFRHNIADANAC
jgi:hypothetical protein